MQELNDTIIKAQHNYQCYEKNKVTLYQENVIKTHSYNYN